MQLIPYLNFNGDCAEAFRFYERCLGGSIESMMTHGESPIADEVPEESRDRIMHASLRLDGGSLLMGSDAPPDHRAEPKDLYVSVTLEDAPEAERIFRELADGGTVVMDMAKTFWADRFGMCVDRFGTPWMINSGEGGGA